MKSESVWPFLILLLGATVLAPLLCYGVVHFVADVWRNRLDSGRYKPNNRNGRSIFYGTMRMYNIRHLNAQTCMGLFMLPALITGAVVAFSLPVESSSNLIPTVMFGVCFGILLLSYLYSKRIWRWIYNRNPEKFDQLEYDLNPLRNKRPGGFRGGRFK